MKKKLHIIGLSQNDHALIMFETLQDMGFWENYDVIFLTDGIGPNSEWGQKHGFTILTINANDMTSAIPQILLTNPKTLLSFGWSGKYPADFLEIFEIAVNFHDGLLPDYRGAQSYMHIYANLEKYYGVTAHYLDAQLDNGNIIIQRKLKMFLYEEPEVIYRRVSELAAMIVPETLRLVENGYKGLKQTGVARYFFKITRSEMDIFRQKNIEHIRNGESIELTPHRCWEID
ncbi:MAG: hypothetical protein E7Z71_03065 [Methanocorpusculum parvum]|nr:hypothetical protein [Methanocorpusculum parvum]